MNILVVGASRGIGRLCVQEAIRAGHTVTALSRTAPADIVTDPRVRYLIGDVTDQATVASAVAGQEAVLITLGLPTRLAIGPPFARRSHVLSAGTRNVIAAMKKTQARRLQCVTAIGTGDSRRLCTPFAGLALRTGLRWLFLEKDDQETQIQTSDLDWTIIRPTALTNGPAVTPQIPSGVRAGLFTHVSRLDVATAMIQCLEDETSYRQSIVVSNPPRFGDTLRWLRAYYGQN